MTTDTLVLYGQTFASRLLLGTSRYPSPQVMAQAVELSQPAMLTASLRRQTAHAQASPEFWQLLKAMKVPVLPNTAGCHSIQEVITTAEMAREVFETDWLKLELIGDDYSLQPDTLKLPEAAERLIKAGFKVLPYCTEDLVLCQRLVDVGCQAVMPWAAPIGTGKGPINPYAMQMLRERLDVPMIVDAGLGLPSHACQVMEWGYDAVLLNTAVALATDPAHMALAFANAVRAGRSALARQHQRPACRQPKAARPFKLACKLLACWAFWNMTPNSSLRLGMRKPSAQACSTPRPGPANPLTLACPPRPATRRLPPVPRRWACMRCYPMPIGWPAWWTWVCPRCSCVSNRTTH